LLLPATFLCDMDYYFLAGTCVVRSVQYMPFAASANLCRINTNIFVCKLILQEEPCLSNPKVDSENVIFTDKKIISYHLTTFSC